MAITRKSVLRWTPIVNAELARGGYPFPADLVLAVIETESGGKVGAVNPKANDSGLMQVIPKTLAAYNKSHPNDTVTLAELQGKDDASAAKQIRVGVAVIASNWRAAYDYLSKRMPQVNTDDLARIADLMYVAGQKGTRLRMNKMDPPITWETIQARFPKWVALKHPIRVFSLLEGMPWPTQDISDWLSKSPSSSSPKSPLDNMSPNQGAILSLAIIFAAWYFMKGRQ